MVPGEHDTGIFIKYATTLSSSNRTEQAPEPTAATLHIILTVNDAFSKEISFLCRHGANGGLSSQTRCYISPTSCLSLMTEEKPRHPVQEMEIHQNNDSVPTWNLSLATRDIHELQLTYRRQFLTFSSRLSPVFPLKDYQPSSLPVRWNGSWCEKRRRSTENQSESRETLKSRPLDSVIGHQYGSWWLVTRLWLARGGRATVNTSRTGRWLASGCSWSDILFPVSDFILWVLLNSNKQMQGHGWLKLHWEMFKVSAFQVGLQHAIN